MIARGELNQRVTLLTPNKPNPRIGEAITTYGHGGMRWARVLPISGQKLTRFRQAGFKATHECSIDYLDWVTPQHRVCWNGDEYAIEGVVNEANKNETLVITMSKASAK